MEIEDKLATESVMFQQYYMEMQENIHNPEIKDFYILSSNWLEEWKKRVGFNDIVGGQNPGPEPDSFGLVDPGLANIDLVLHYTFAKPEEYWYTEESKEKEENIVLRPNIELDKDYIIIDKNILTLFENNY